MNTTNKLIINLILILLFTQKVWAIDVPHISVQAEASVQAMPDYMQLQVSIEKTDKTKSKAKAHVDDISADVLALLKRYKIAAKTF